MVEGFSELVQASGISVPARARFVGRFLGYTTFGALTFGLVCGQLGVLIGLGPLIPFAWGSWFGYTLSSISFLRAEFATAREYVRDYPRLLEYVLRTEFSWAQLPQEISVDQWAEGSLPRLSWCVLASQSCQVRAGGENIGGYMADVEETVDKVATKSDPGAAMGMKSRVQVAAHSIQLEEHI
ncbi:unnamed protein product [Durusdinium trenchii]|uniref:Vesicle transport protein n=1 Tax=Durusdinium trenchii TaxID=1381693 RepID=A0ABP0QVU0_9DINO